MLPAVLGVPLMSALGDAYCYNTLADMAGWFTCGVPTCSICQVLKALA